LGLTKAVGGVLALALSRELVPVITAVIMAGRIGSAYAAELGTMRVSEQIDSLRMLSTDPVDYLVTPRVIACAIALPLLAILCFAMGISASVLLAGKSSVLPSRSSGWMTLVLTPTTAARAFSLCEDLVYDVGPNVILDSASKALQKSDIFALILKSVVFGAIISSVSCSWGMTTQGGAKGVGESTTSAVVISLGENEARRLSSPRCELLLITFSWLFELDVRSRDLHRGFLLVLCHLPRCLERIDQGLHGVTRSVEPIL